ncbi:MAG: hypothetical protein RR811_14260, partial [Comamonas sp.]
IAGIAWCTVFPITCRSLLALPIDIHVACASLPLRKRRCTLCQSASCSMALPLGAEICHDILRSLLNEDVLHT